VQTKDGTRPVIRVTMTAKYRPRPKWPTPSQGGHTLPQAPRLAQKAKDGMVGQRSTWAHPPPIPPQICGRAPQQCLVGRMLANVLLSAVCHSVIWPALLTFLVGRSEHSVLAHHTTAYSRQPLSERTPVPDLNGQANAQDERV
jgi:hypothetical protein